MKPKEEAKAAALWAFIERIREEDEAVVDGLGGLTPGEVEQLARLLQTAAGLRRAFSEQGAEAGSGAVERIRAAIAAHPRGSETRTARVRAPRPGFAALWRRPVLAAVTILALGTAFAAGRYAPSRVHPERPPAAGIASIPCSEVRGCFDRLTAGELPRQEEQSVLAHLSRCAHCRDAYRAYCRQHPPAAPGRAHHAGTDLAMR